MNKFELFSIDLEDSLEEVFSAVLDKELKDSHQHMLNIIKRNSLLSEDDAFDIENIYLLGVKQAVKIAYVEGFNHRLNKITGGATPRIPPCYHFFDKL